jgi:small subunit ribosomal protein S8
VSMTDPIADLLTRIRNAQRAGLEKVELPSSKMKLRICEALQQEGFVREVSFSHDPGTGPQGKLTVVLKYDHDKRPVISEIRRQSKPGLRRYVAHTDIPNVMNGLGIALLSTSKGVMVDREARKQHLGGELLATVW